MKVLIVSTGDIRGGAYRGAYRLHTGLRSVGVDSTMVVREKASEDPSVVTTLGRLKSLRAELGKTLDLLPLRLYATRPRTTWSIGWLRNQTLACLQGQKCDLVHLQWIGNGFLPISAIGGMKTPVIWTLRDMWAFTGGCHYPDECTRYREGCGACPQLGSRREWDLSRWVWQAKKRYCKKADLTIVTLSRWLAHCARASSLFSDCRVEVIPNGLDPTVFRPLNKAASREILGLDAKKKIILTGAFNVMQDPRKGFDLLRQALVRLSLEWPKDSMELVAFGGGGSDDDPEQRLGVRRLGRLHDDTTLALCYSAADVFVAPSRQEAFGNTVLEAAACGTPTVTFDRTGPADIVEHKRSGYLARPFEVEDLAAGISWVLADEERWRALSTAARNTVEEQFAIDKIAQRYVTLYEDVLGLR